MNSSMIVTEPLPDDVWEHVGWQGSELWRTTRTPTSTPSAPPTTGSRSAAAACPTGSGRVRTGRGVTQRQTVELLSRMLVQLFPAASEAPVAARLVGVLGVPRDWCSTVHLDHATGLGWAGGYVGSGVTATNLAGRTLRDLVLRRDTPLTRLPWVGRQVRHWEPEPLRWLGVRLSTSPTGPPTGARTAAAHALPRTPTSLT